MGVLMFSPLLFSPARLAYKIYSNYYNKSGKFIKQGWLLQEGDV
jgi:hypothetical protein